MYMKEEKDRIIKLILGIESENSRKSTLQLALKQARRLVGVNHGEHANRVCFSLRNSNEEFDAEEIADSYLRSHSDEAMDVLTSLSLYLIILDQLGHVFGEQSNKSNRIKDSLDIGVVVSEMNDKELNAIKELRNSLNHNFGLAGYNPHKDIGVIKYTICFADDGNQKPLVEPTKEWEGDWTDKDDNTSYHVYPFSLINYMEDVILSLTNKYLKGLIKSPLCVEELKTRFTIVESTNEYSTPEDLSLEVTDDDLANAQIDEYGAKYSADGNRLLQMQSEEIKEYAIKEGTKVICNECFSFNYSLEQVTIPSSVIRIGNGAFNGCDSLKELSLPSSVLQIGEEVFKHCDSMKRLFIPNSVKSIGKYSFDYCKSLEQITVPDSIVYVGENPFSGCDNLKQITSDSKKYIFKEGAFYSSNMKSLVFCISKNDCFTIPNSVIQICDYAFQGCSSLKQIIIPNIVKIIGNKTFSRCFGLTNILLPNSVKEIGDSAFEGCESITKLSIPDSVSGLGKGTFQFCYSLVQIDIPDTITEIGDGAFYECCSLKTIRLPRSITHINRYTFNKCKSLREIDVPEYVEEIDGTAFGGGNSLNKIFIPTGTRGKFEALMPYYKSLLVEI